MLIVVIVILATLKFRIDNQPPITATPTTTETKLPTPSATETKLPTPSATETKLPTPSATKTVPPTSITNTSSSQSPFIPILGTLITNPPLRFGVESWVETSAKCWTTVTIYGVIISRGNSPYTFTFWKQKAPYSPETAYIIKVTPLKNSRDHVEFSPPIVVVKGKYKHVELTFVSENGNQVTWIDDLYYPPPDNSCR